MGSKLTGAMQHTIDRMAAGAELVRCRLGGGVYLRNAKTRERIKRINGDAVTYARLDGLRKRGLIAAQLREESSLDVVYGLTQEGLALARKDEGKGK